jgi:hypothetical protein
MLNSYRWIAGLLLAALLLLAPQAAHAQGCGSNNPNCSVPTAPNGTSTNQAASTAFVQNALGGGSSIALPNGQILIGQSNGKAAGVTPSGDCTLSVTGVVTCLKTNGVNFGSFATQSAPTGTANNCLEASAGGVVTGTGLACGASAQTPNVQTSNYTVQTSDCGNTIQAGTGSTGFLTLTLPSVASGPFQNGCTVYVKNGDGWASGRGKAVSGFPSDFTNGQGILWPLQAGAVQVINGAWATLERPGRAKIPFGTQTFNTNFTSGSDTAGVTDCMATGASACKTLQHTLFMGCNEFDFNGSPQTLYTIVMASGVTDTQPVHYACPQIPGAQGGAAITVNMNGGTIQAAAVGEDAIAIDVGATIAIFGGSLFATGVITDATRSADCLRADFGGRIFYAGEMTFLSCSGSDLAAENGGYMLVQGNDTVSGNGASHFFARGGGVISTDYVTVTISTTLGTNVTKTSAWALAGPGGSVDVPSWTYLSPGGFTNTGAKAATTGTGSINTSAMGASNNSACVNSYFPGTVNNAVAAPFCN